MQIHQLKRKNPDTKKISVGRGGKRGKTSGRGHKGQKARAGRKLRPEIRDMVKKIPKRRGYGKNRARSYNASNTKPVTINLALLEENFDAGEVVNLSALLTKDLVKKIGGKNPKVKILGNGDLKKKLNIENLLVSMSANEKIEKAGGSIK
jgi:large subunit ribosomal protein L15